MASDILKKTLLHYINLEYYANELDEEFQTLLEELTERCNKAISSQKTINTKATYKSLINIINEEIDEYQKELEERLDVMAELVMNGELEFLDETYNAPIREGKGSSLLIKGALALGGVSLSKVLFAPLDGRDTLDQFVDRTAKNISRAYDTALRSGYLFGQKSEEITSQVSSQMKQVSRGVQSGIRTIVPSVAKNTDKIVFLNNDIEVVWCATLDGRTCINCASLSGLHFKSIADAPTYPQHCLCRCVLIPASTVKEPIPDFDEFIEMLDEDEQKSVLGTNRFNLMKEYGIKPNKFLNNGRVIPSDVLKISIKSGAKSNVINILKRDDILKNIDVVNDYYNKIRTGNNKELITVIAKNSDKPFSEIEQVINHIFKEKHNFEGGIVKYFDPSEEIVKALERLRTGEHTDKDILLLNHEFAELTYMKNKKYNIYEVAHKMANKKYNWQEVIDENLS